MNSYNLVISGYWWLLVLFIIAGFGLSFWAYKTTIPPISEKKRYLLISLRGFALAILIFAIFEPIYSITRAFIEKPKIAILLDNSISAGTTDAKGNRADAFRNALINSNIDNLDNITFLFDSDVKQLDKFNTDSLAFDGRATDISKALRRLDRYRDEENIRAVVLFTDGAYNAGSNPIFDAERFTAPFYVVGIGDTTEPVDIAVLSIVTNEIAYVDNKIQIMVNFKANGFSNKTIKLKLFFNEEKIAEQEIFIEPGRERFFHNFEYTPTKPGTHKITAQIDPIENEITRKNNSISEFIRVLENKRNFAIFAGSPSPDLSMIKQSILLEKGVEIKEFIQKKGAEFYETPNPKVLQASELIVFVGFPVQSTPKNVIDMIKLELEQGKPLLFIASQTTDYNKLKEFQNYLPFVVVSSRPQELLVVPDFKTSALSSPILRITGSDDDLKLWNSLPPLFRTETFVRPKAESEVLSTMKINNTPLNEPLIMSRHFQNSKSIALMGYGLHRWKLFGYASELAKGRDAEDLLNIFINNSLRWLSIAEQTKPVKVRPSRKFYNENEVVELFGEVYDAAYNPIEKANLKVKIVGKNDTREITLSPTGLGNYYATVEGLPSGDYSFSAEATLNNNVLGTDDGRFSIGEISIEYLNLKMNEPLLKKIAEITGGKFYYSDNVSSIIDDIQKNRFFTERSITKRNDIIIWNLPYLLILVVLLLSAEWFIRKRSGML